MQIDRSIEKLDEKLQALYVQGELIFEKAIKKVEQHREEGEIRYNRKNIHEKLTRFTFQREIQSFKSTPSAPKKKSLKGE